MRIFNSLDEIGEIGETAAALGNFDGIHKGHQALIDEAVKTAAADGLKSAVFTFSNHPRNVLAGDYVVKNVIYADEKVRLLEEAGIDYLFSIDFNESIMCRTPEEFVDDILIRKFRMKAAVCGFNFTYGFKAAGTSESLAEYAGSKGVDVHVIDPVKVDGEVVSSTLIRRLICDGRMERVCDMMGRPYMIRGEIIHGNKLGGPVLGFPTCNTTLDKNMVAPRKGAYVTKCVIGGAEYASMTNVGTKPTIGDYQTNVETHIFDFDKDVYGKRIEVYFLSMIRPEQKFSGLDELIAQLVRDKVYARKQLGI